MSELRKEFEALDDIEQGLRHCHYNESTNDYHADVSHEETHEWHTQFVNGAWYAFQEQQDKIDELQKKIKFQETGIKNLKLQLENKQIDCDRYDAKIDAVLSAISQAERHQDRTLFGLCDELMELLK